MIYKHRIIFCVLYPTVSCAVASRNPFILPSKHSPNACLAHAAKADAEKNTSSDWEIIRKDEHGEILRNKLTGDVRRISYRIKNPST